MFDPVAIEIDEETKEAIREALEDMNKPIGVQTPIEFADGVELVPLSANTAKPFKHTNLTLFRGDKKTLIVDPGWNSEATNSDAILDTIKTEELLVFLTHHHKDHVNALDIIEKRFPHALLYAHPFTLERIETGLKSQKVEKGTIDLEKDGEKWPIRIIGLPGHTKGHMGLHDERNNVVIAGDHVVGRGTALLDPRSGSVADYLKSIEFLLKLKPRLIFPAHGPVIFKPEKTLNYYYKHRMEREQQIIESLQNGNDTVHKIVRDIYRDVSQALWRYAGFNVFLHLKKLMEEGKVKIKGDKEISEENYEIIKFQLVQS